MKKILLTVLVFTMVLGASAQTDGFFRDGGSANDYSRTGSGSDPALPGLPRGYGVGATNDDQSAPLGSGLLVLTALGAGYVVRKREKSPTAMPK